MEQMQQIESHTYADQVIADQPQNFRGVEVNGVRTEGPLTEGLQSLVRDDTNPEFFSVYVRHMDGRALCVGDLGTRDEAVHFGRNLAAGYADSYGWTFTSTV